MRRRPSSTLFPYTTLFRSLAVALARIRWAGVLVELVRGKRSAEGVHRDLHAAPPEQAVRVQGDQMGLRGEVVAAGEVHTGGDGVHALGQAARLVDAVVRCRVAERRVPRSRVHSDLAE